MSARLTPEQAELLRSRGDRWLDAYYYSFEPTGVEAIDLILAAVARAGKLAHSTESWTDDDYWSEHYGATPAEMIQLAANAAAADLPVQGEPQQ